MMTSPTQNRDRRAAQFRFFGAPLLTLGILLGLATVTGVKSAHSQQAPPTQRLACTAHEKMTQFLGTKFTEAPTSLGLASDGKVLEVFASEDGESWTMVATAPEGISCIVASGKYWQQVPAKPKGPEV